ncbi:MAG TPA: hypothetical protein VHT29_12440 [Solirubrobacteraceae bacterium]|nr:hypothetical protein [Solirubrobacteraceae bacterium]
MIMRRFCESLFGRVITGRASVVSSLAIAVLGCQLGVLATSARAERPHEPAWEVLAAAGPTHLPPVQSAIQEVTVGGEAGSSFTLSHSLSEGTGTFDFANGYSETTAGSNVVWVWFPLEGTFKVGQQVDGAGIPDGTTIIGISGSPSEPFLELSNDATASNEFSEISASSTEITDVTGQFQVGEEITGAGIPAATTITAVGPSSITISKLPTAGGKDVTIASRQEQTAALPLGASAAQVQAALEALPGYREKTFSVSGGPGADPGNAYFIAFGGSLNDQEVANFVVTGSGLGEHGYARARTSLPGGAGTGEIAIYPTNLGGKASSGPITVDLGPLPAGVVTAGPAKGTEAGWWTCTTEPSKVQCTTENVAKTLAPTASITVPIKVQLPSEAKLQTDVSVSGGEATQSASYLLPLEISPTPAGVGVAALYSKVLEADGSPSTQAGGHPYSQATLFAVNSVRSSAGGGIVPVGELKDADADLQAGFVGSPLTTPRCPTGEPYNCPYAGDARVGHLYPGVNAFGDLGFEGQDRAFSNAVPVLGAAAQFSTEIAQPVATLLGRVRSSEDFGIRIESPDNSPFDPVFYIDTVFFGQPAGAKGKAFFRNPTDCAAERQNPPEQSLTASSWQDPDSFRSRSDRLAPVEGCDQLHFEPQFELQPSSTQGSSGVGATAHLHIDQSGLTDPNKLGAPDLKKSVVTLPEGFDVNPAQANGLDACSEAQVGYEMGRDPLPLNPTRFDEDPVSCPDASKLGTVEATSPLLEAPLKGTIYLAAQEENPFHSLIGIYLVFESERFGITLKLPGKVEADPATGQLTATFDYLPQQPIEDLTLDFRGGGPRSEFATPEVCGTYATIGAWTPWSAPESGPPAQTSNSFSVSSGCSSSASARPFSPSFEAGTTQPSAGSYSPLVIKVNRNDGEQELTSLDFTLPEGLIGNLASVPYCPDAAIEAARGVSGKAEQASPSCPAASQIGSVDAAAGVGSEPIHVGGHVYMAGPYEGAPLSAVVITPAVAGPFDLGNVVIRTPLTINPATAQIAAKSDPIPTILKGIPLKIRSIVVTLDRPGFTLNPTSCAAMSVTASIGSSNGATATPSNRFQVGGCSSLPFKPALSASTQAKASKANGASLTVKVAAKPGEANIGKVNLQLPLQLPSRLSTLQKACTEAQFNTNPAACPAESVIGSGTAHTPILQVPLSGPAYLVSHGGAAFPDVEFVLQADERGGDIEIVLDGGTQIKKGITYSNFETVPDAPISSFETVLPEGPHSIVTAYLPVGANYNLCGQSLTMPTTITGQNGAVLKQNTPIAVTGCAPAIRVTRHTVKGTATTLVVSVPSGGKLTARGSGLTSVAKTVAAAKSVTLTLKLNKKEQAFLARHRHRKLKLQIKLQFTPKKGARLSTATTVLVG